MSFDSLPLRRPGPRLNAWGLYGEDERGTLNLITEDVVKRAREEIQSGVVVNLNLPLSFPRKPMNPARAALKHEILHRNHCNDDHVTFNTQCSTHWDGYRHYPYQHYPEKNQFAYYNDMSSEEARDGSNRRNGVQNYAEKGITSRGHLLDIASFIENHSLPPVSYFDTSTPIPLSMLLGCAEEANIKFRKGDILLIRTGWTEAFSNLSDEEQESLPKRAKRGSLGVAQGIDMLRWHWEQGIAAVASDTPAYECWPTDKPDTSLHEVFLSGWGMPIGETFDLRALAAECKKQGRWTFFFASMVLNIEGGIASPANAQAIL